MKIYDTLTRQIQNITPLNPPTVTIYTCGPTVYDHAHVGHWFTYIRMDLLIRVLKANKLDTKWVMNITDVGHLTSDADEGEDKLEKGAKREGKTAWEVAEFYTNEFLADMAALNILTPDFLVKATDHIPEQIDLIKTLEEKGYTYAIDDGIYYDTSKFSHYADFAKLDLDEQQPGKRVMFNPQKRNSTDFALWKFSPIDQKRDMEWDSPWGKGFPGWHIECSAMSMKYLGETLDIHCGGIDHIPVHHTNEIAQSEAATDKPFSNIWMHSNHITINGEKVSKSLGNGITLKEIIEKGFSPEILRLHVLESHYRSQSKFSWESLVSAKGRMQDLMAMAALKYQTRELGKTSSEIEKVYSDLLNILSNDLATPQAVAYLSNISGQLLQSGLDNGELDKFENMLKAVDELLGLKLSTIKDIDEESKELINKREEARVNKDWPKADELRKELLSRHISIEDKPNGPQWSWTIS